MSYAFTDTHCHFDFPPFTGHEAESLTRSASAGVQRIIVPTVTADRFARVLRLAQDHAPLFAALGLHPLYIAQHHEPQLTSWRRCWPNGRASWWRWGRSDSICIWTTRSSSASKACCRPS